jgi:nickel-dependent lactate racemase
MPKIDLKYGRTLVPLRYNESRFSVLGSDRQREPLTDPEIGARLDEPIDSLPLDDLIRPGDRVLLVVSDATRQTGAGQVVNLLARRLIANGSNAADINIIFATGIHRRVSDEERRTILSPFIIQRMKTIDHDANDPIKNFRVGEISGGIPVELDWTLTEFDHIVLIGGITFHYFAGFTGGRKLICPGLASAKTISATHRLAFDCETMDRRQGVGTGLLDGNAVHEAFLEAASFAKPSFAVNTIVDNLGRVIDLYCGDWISSHRHACDAYAEAYTVPITEKRELVVASCGGYPLDINLIQAHKALEAASVACRDGGVIVLLAECEDGLGRSDFLDWFDARDSNALAQKLCESYQVNGQTAWSLLKKAERFDIRLASRLDAQTIGKMRLSSTELNAVQQMIASASGGYVIPFGAKFRIV